MKQEPVPVVLDGAGVESAVRWGEVLTLLVGRLDKQAVFDRKNVVWNYQSLRK